MAESITKNRSTFNQTHSVKTTSSLGKVIPTLCEFVTPDTTVRNSTDTYIELKPTTNKLNTTIQSVLNTYYVPLKRVWEGADNFISSAGHLAKNGALNEPYSHFVKDKNVNALPCINVAKTFGMLLACINGTNNQMSDTYFKTPFAATAAKDYFSFDYKDTDGWAQSFQCSTSSPMAFWLSRLIGTGITQTPYYNLRPHFSGTVLDYWELYCCDPEIMAKFKDLYYYRHWDDFQAIRLCWSTQGTDKTYFILQACADMYTHEDWMAVPDSTWHTFYVRRAKDHYGEIKINTREMGGNYGCKISNVNAFDTVLCMLFGGKNMLGKGSLVEAIGCPLFRYRQPERTTLPYSDNYSFVKHWDTRASWSLDSNNFVTWKQSYCFSALPFFAYQAIISDRYLLPRDVLSNVTPKADGSDGFRCKSNGEAIDNDYCHNLLVPTKCYEQNETALHDLWEGCVDNFGTPSLSFYGSTDILTTTERRMYAITFNQLCSIFLDRSPLIDVDFYTHVWQRPDNNVTGLLGTSISSPIVDANRKADAKQMVMSKAIARFLKRGGFNMSASDYIETHFGVKDVIEEENGVVTVSTDKCIIQTEDIVNTGGAQDNAGNNLALGAKATVASSSKGKRGYFEFYAKQYGIILQLHHLAVCNEYFNTPNVTFHRLGDMSIDTLDFATMFNPEFQDTGDEPIYADDYQLGVVLNNPQYGWKCKNFFLKDKQNRVLGEYCDLYREQIICPTDPTRNLSVPIGLNYRFLQKTPFDYSPYFVDAIGDNVLLNVKQNLYRKAPLTRENVVGYL